MANIRGVIQAVNETKRDLEMQQQVIEGFEAEVKKLVTQMATLQESKDYSKLVGLLTVTQNELGTTKIEIEKTKKLLDRVTAAL